MADQSIFRFMAVRPANLKNKQVAIEKRIPLYSATADKSDLHKSLEQARSRNASKEQIVAVAKKFKDTSAYVKVIDAMSFDVRPLMKWLEANRNKPLKDIDLHGDLQALYGRDLAVMVQSTEFMNSYIALADTILSDNIAREGVGPRDEVVLAFKLLNLLKRAKDDASAMRKEEKFGRIIAHSIVVLPEVSNLRDVKPTSRVESKRQDKREAKPDEHIQEVNRLEARLKELETAHRELSRLASDESAIFKPKRDAALLARVASMEHRISELSLRTKLGDKVEQQEGQSTSHPLVEALSENRISRTPNEFALSLNAVRTLSEASQKVLRELKLEPDRINPIKAVGLIEQEINYVNSRLPSEQTQTKLIMLGGVLLDQAKFKKALEM